MSINRHGHNSQLQTMSLTPNQTEEDDSKPPGLFTQLIPEQLPNYHPVFSINCFESGQNRLLCLEFYEDFILTKTEKGHFCLFLDHQIGFQTDLQKLSLTLERRQTRSTQIFLTENKQKLEECYLFLKGRCPQRNFHLKYSMGIKEGNGKNASVYQIKRISDDAIYAAKVQTYSSSLRQQISILGELRHPNLIYFHEYFIEEDYTTYIVLDHENGGNLLNILTNQNCLTPKKKVKIVTDLLNGLQYLRIKGIVHRDLKLENILYSQTDGNFKIADFGLARKTNCKYTKIVGTPGYMAPELLVKADFKQTDIRSDIYSMGLIFYEIFTGSQFYQGSSRQEVLANNMKGRSYRWEQTSENQMSKYEKQLLRLMIRSKKEKRKNSYEILKSDLFRKITKIFGLDFKKSKSPSSRSRQHDDQNFILPFKNIQKIPS